MKEVEDALTITKEEEGTRCNEASMHGSRMKLKKSSCGIVKIPCSRNKVAFPNFAGSLLLLYPNFG